MLICIFSDIHGNAPAFRIAGKMIVSEKADINIFLGDLCGYYFNQMEALQILKDIPGLIAIKGNHDDIFLQILKGNDNLRRTYLEKYGDSMERLIGQNNDELVQWLSALPESYTDSDMEISAYHGSPWNTMDGYVYPDSPLEGFLEHQASVFMLGHTHYPMIRSIGNKIIINPGSLGQPRHGGWPSYVLFDSVIKEVEFREVKYDMSELTKSIDKSGDVSPYLRKVLERVKDE